MVYHAPFESKSKGLCNYGIMHRLNQSPKVYANDAIERWFAVCIITKKALWGGLNAIKTEYFPLNVCYCKSDVISRLL